VCGAAIVCGGFSALLFSDYNMRSANDSSCSNRFERGMEMKTAIRLVWLPVLFAFSLSIRAEVTEINIGYQYGIGYTPFHVMERQGLVEKYAKAAGISLKATYRNLGTPGVVRDAMLAGDVQYGAVGVPTLIILADKSDLDFKAVGNIVSLPMNFNVNTSVVGADFCNMKGKIALPTVKSSVQAVTLQIAAKQKCHDSYKLDPNTVSMTHPDGMAALLNNQVDAHLTAPPFNDLEVKMGNGRIKTLFDSYSVLGGPTSFILLVGSQKFANQNPKAHLVLVKAFEEAIAWTAKNKQQAAELYVSEEKSKDTVADVFSQMSDPKMIFDTTPNRIGVYAQFMKEIGTVKHNMSWKDLSMSNLTGRKGS
jgi:NitT/TauT family transport system substrate-binding protein